MKVEQIIFRATSDDALKLTELAKACGLSRSEALRSLISNARIEQRVTSVPTTTISTQTKNATRSAKIEGSTFGNN